MKSTPTPPTTGQVIQRVENRVLLEQVAWQLNRVPNVKFLLVWNFKSPEDIRTSFTKYRQGGGREVLAVFKSEVFEGYSVLAIQGTPNFMMLPSLGFNPVRRDKANWRPRVWQYSDEDAKGWGGGHEGRNYRNYEVADNFRWMPFDQLIEFIRKDFEISLIYK
jgi:hypothetical protein